MKIPPRLLQVSNDEQRWKDVENYLNDKATQNHEGLVDHFANSIEILSKKHEYIDELLAIKTEASIGYILAENRKGFIEMLLLIRNLLGMNMPDKLHQDEPSFKSLSKIDHMKDILDKIRSTSAKFKMAEIPSNQRS